jgi:tryptophan-rich sensory protein
MAIRIIVFLIINFAALAIGGLVTGTAVKADWYTSLNQAPWTPPGWVFGAAWTSIMICFSIFMAYLWPEVENKKLLIGLFSVQWLLNVLWNPIFFHFHLVIIGLVVISSLTILMFFILFKYYPLLGGISWLTIPYVIWLLIATSLNAYIYVYN